MGENYAQQHSEDQFEIAVENNHWKPDSQLQLPLSDLIHNFASKVNE